MIDVVEQINAMRRQVGSRVIEAGEARAVIVSRTYPAALEDLWEACTDAERIRRWFLPVSGELKVGGRYQLEGNAGGVVERCDPPSSFAATWEYNDQVSWIEVRLTAQDIEHTRFELEHVALVDQDLWDLYGPGATGVGWDLGLLGLQLHLVSSEPADDAAFEAWSVSDEGKRFVKLSSERWRDANIAAGTADEAAAQASADRTTAFYTGTETEPETP